MTQIDQGAVIKLLKTTPRRIASASRGLERQGIELEARSVFLVCQGSFGLSARLCGYMG
jgi:hypothetical protein